MELGEKIKKLRQDKKLSIRELARRSDMSHSYLSQLESGKKDRPAFEIIQKIAIALDVDYIELLETQKVSAELQNKLNEAIKKSADDTTGLNLDDFRKQYMRSYMYEKDIIKNEKSISRDEQQFIGLILDVIMDSDLSGYDIERMRKIVEELEVLLNKE